MCDAPDWQLGKKEPMDTSTQESGGFTLTGSQYWEQKELKKKERESSKYIFTYCRHMATRPAEIYLITDLMR